MELENLQNQCPYCGGDWKKEANHNGLEQWKCKNCGYEIIVKNENDLKAILVLATFSDKVISLLHAKQNGGKSERIKKWRENDKEFQKIIDDYGGALAKDPLFAMAHAAHMTDGFEIYEPKSEKVTVEALYSVANDYVKNNPSAKNIKELITLYRRKLRNKTKNALIILLSAVVVCIAACFTALSLYSPIPLDEKSGITVSVPSSSVSVFNKFGVDINVEEQSSTSPAYIDAKNALRNETDKFVLYDLSLTNGSKALDFDGSVKVTIPIPEGYQTGALKIFHVISDEEYEEIPSTVSEADNTISFETTHFSLYAVAERHPIVTFDSDGGNEIERQIVQRDSLAKKPEDPEKQGYTFGGWMNGKEAWNFAVDTVKKDVNLTAKWIANEYTVTLIANGGNISSETLKVSYMSAYSELPENVVKAGYTFLGWYTAESNGTKVTAATIMQMAADHTLYAMFDENVNKVVFNANGGSGNMADFELKTGETARLPQNLFNRTGYVFMGWSSGSTGDVLWGDKYEYTMGTDSSYTLYAVWVINTNVLQFDANGGTGTMAPISMNYQSEQRLPENAFVRSGYKFVGWSTSAQGSKEYDDKSIYVMGEKAENVLYAVWEKKINKLHFDANGGIGSMNYISAEYQAPIQLPNCEFTRYGFEFVGWSTVPNGSPVTEFSMGADDDQTLYACWRALENPFTFNANGGEGNMETGFTIETGGKANLPKNKFTRVGYKFIGWSTDAYGTVKYVDEAVFEMNKHGEVTLYAVWEKISYNITYENIKSGDNSKNITSYDIETYFELKNISSAGYIFDGWYDIDENKVEIIDDRTGDIVLKAKWSLENYDIVYNNTKDALNENIIEYNIETANIVLKNIACTGYIFDGWYNQAGEKIAEIPQGSIGKLVLEARWSLENYAIEYANTKDVSNSNVTSYTIESGTITLKPISIAGYDFVGWFDENENIVTEIASGSTGNIALTARWTAITYKIEYKNTKGADNNNVADYTIESSDIELKKISVNGYIFDGWFNQAGQEVKVISKGSINGLVLEARWTPEVYTIEYKNTKNSSNANPTSYNIETCTITLVNLESDGYVFNGWYDASGNKVDEIPVGSIGDITLKAEWSVVNYRIVYNNTKGAENTNLTEFNIESGDIQLKDISVAGFRFDGWYNTSGTKVTVIPTGSMGEIVLEAKWTANSYIVKYDSNGGTGDMSDSNHTYGESKKLNANAFTRRGYTFAGWSLSPDGSVVYENLAAVENLTVDNNGVVRLYAQWTFENYMIIYDTNGGTNISDGSYNIDSEFKLPIPIKNGYEFLGWYNNRAFEGEAVEWITPGNIGRKTYYARWSEPVEYTISFESNGGNSIPVKNYNVNTPTFTLPEATREHYQFVGWYDNYNCTGTPIATIAKGSYGDIDLYAKWKPIDYIISYVTNGGSAISSKTYNIESNTFQLATPTRAGYQFQGWYDNANFDGERIVNIATGSTGNKTFYAKWEANEFTIIYHENGGKFVEEIYTIKYKVTDTIIIPTLKYSSYPEYIRFLGWYEDGKPFVNDLITNPRNLELYPIWDEITEVYNGIASLPTDISSGRFIVDLSTHTGSNACDKTINVTNASEVIFIGNIEATFTNLHIVVKDYTEKQVKLVFVDFNMTGDITDSNNPADMKVTIECKGTSTITATSTSTAAISGFTDLTIEGDGNLTVIGSNGTDGADGADRSHSEGATGYSGENGSDGSSAIFDCDSVILNCTGNITFIGGDGGDGGNGGNITGQSDGTDAFQNPAGGNGGNGGNGGCPIDLSTLKVISCGTLSIQYGNGGDGGNGGKGGSALEQDKNVPDNGGDGGNGGNGGNGAKGGAGGDGGNGGHSFGRSYGFMNSKEYRGESGDAGDGGKGGNTITGVLYNNSNAQILAGVAGLGGKQGKIGTVDKDAHSGITGAPGRDGVSGITDNSYYFDFVDILNS